MVDVHCIEQLRPEAKARLIPVLAETSKENRATSVFLACLSAVDEFAKSMLGSIGQRIGKRATIKCYTEVVLDQEEGKRDRPDGLIVVTVGSRKWAALIESKIGGSVIDADQVSRYLSIAKVNGINALITVSNEFAAIPTHHPVKISKPKLKGLDLYHWSWMFILTQADLLLKTEEIINIDQSFILQEMVRYFRADSI